MDGGPAAAVVADEVFPGHFRRIRLAKIQAAWSHRVQAHTIVSPSWTRLRSWQQVHDCHARRIISSLGITATT